MEKAKTPSLILADTKDKSSLKPSIKNAKEILGRKKVFSSKSVSKAWDAKKVEKLEVPFFVETLESCAAENAAGKSDWRLVYDLGQTLIEMFLKQGEDQKNQPCFHPTPNFYPKLFREPNHMHPYYKEESPWIEKSKKSAYRLIDFTPRFEGMSFDEQERCIRLLGEKFLRTSAPIFAESLMSMFMVSKKRAAEDWYHWAPEKHMYGGYHVAIGRFISYGLATMPGYEGSGHGTVVSRKSDL